MASVVTGSTRLARFCWQSIAGMHDRALNCFRWVIVQGLCIVADNILDECYLVADVLSKAVFGLTMWHTKTKILKVLCSVLRISRVGLLEGLTGHRRFCLVLVEFFRATGK